jgi:hypothetical protein
MTPVVNLAAERARRRPDHVAKEVATLIQMFRELSDEQQMVLLPLLKTVVAGGRRPDERVKL